MFSISSFFELNFCFYGFYIWPTIWAPADHDFTLSSQISLFKGKMRQTSGGIGAIVARTGAYASPSGGCR